MWRTIKALNAKIVHACQSATFEETRKARRKKGKVSEKMPGENVVTLDVKTPNATVSDGIAPAIAGKTVKNEITDARENGLPADDKFSLFEDFLRTDIDMVDSDLCASDQDHFKADYDVNFGVFPTPSTPKPKLKLCKPRNAKPSVIENRKCCRPKPAVKANVIKKASSTKPCRIKKLPAKLADAKMDSAEPVACDILPEIELGPVAVGNASVIHNANATISASNLTKIMNANFVNKIVKVEKCVEVLSNGPPVNGIHNGKIEDRESKNLKITMTKVGDGIWEQVMKTNVKKRRYRWKMGNMPKKKRKIEQIDHDYTPNRLFRQSGDGNDNNSFMGLAVKSSPSRHRTTPNRLKDCVEVPPSPCKTSPTTALRPSLPSPPAKDEAANDSAGLKTPNVKTKSSKKLMKIEAENLLKRFPRTGAKTNPQIPGSEIQPLPRKRAASKLVASDDSKSQSPAIPDSVGSPKMALLDPTLQTNDGNRQKQSPLKGVKVKKNISVKVKKLQKTNGKTSTNKTLKKEKTSVKVKASTVRKSAKADTKVAKLTAKAKAIRLQIKAERKKGQSVCKTKVKKLSEVKEVHVVVNNLNNIGLASCKKVEATVSSEMQPAPNASPKKMSLISHMKKKAKPSIADSKVNEALASSAESSEACKSSENCSTSRGRPRGIAPRKTRPKTIRFSRNGIRIGRPPKTVDGENEEIKLVGSQIQLLQSTLATCFSPSDSSGADKAKAAPIPPGSSVPKNSSNAIRNRLSQSNAHTSIDASASGPRAPVSMSHYAFIPQSTMVANNPKRCSVRQTECAFRYKEIVVKKQDNFIQIVLTATTRVKNGLNCEGMHEIGLALAAARNDPKCSVVVVNGTGSVFCSGVDLISLSMDQTQGIAEKMSSAIRNLCKALITFPKPLIAAVNGAAVGLGVTFLPFFDLVYASDKASFYTPYCKLGQIPEGGATFTLPSIMGYARANSLLLEGRRITAIEAYEYGLVTQVLWPATFMEEVIPRVQAFASRPLQAMESTKALIRYHKQRELEVTLDTECSILLKQWSSNECRAAIRDFLTSEEMV